MESTMPWTEITRLQYRRDGLRFASDTTDTEWALLQPLMPAPAGIGRPRTTDLRAIVNAILYVLATGCQWRALGREFPPRSTVQGYFYSWRDDGTWHCINRSLVRRARHGIGLRTAVAILVRMPEIGRVSREQAAAIAGLAPYDDDSGQRRGLRHIKGGRQRLRQSLYAAALPAAFYWNTQLKALYKRLIAAGKTHKLVLVACARKLLIFVNTVVARGTPWKSAPATT